MTEIFLRIQVLEKYIAKGKLKNNFFFIEIFMYCNESRIAGKYFAKKNINKSNVQTAHISCMLLRKIYYS